MKCPFKEKFNVETCTHCSVSYSKKKTPCVGENNCPAFKEWLNNRRVDVIDRLTKEELKERIKILLEQRNKYYYELEELKGAKK